MLQQTAMSNPFSRPEALSLYAELSDDDLYKSEGSSSKEEEDDYCEGELLRCRDTDRPKRALTLVIEAPDKEYTMIHDYVSARTCG